MPDDPPAPAARFALAGIFAVASTVELFRIAARALEDVEPATALGLSSTPAHHEAKLTIEAAHLALHDRAAAAQARIRFRHGHAALVDAQHRKPRHAR